MLCSLGERGEGGIFSRHFLRSKKAPILPDRLPSCSVAMNFLHPRICHSLGEGGRAWRDGGGSSRERNANEGEMSDLSPLRQALWHGSCRFNCSFMSFLRPICLSHPTDPPFLLPLVLFPLTFPFPHQILLKHENDFPTWFFMMWDKDPNSGTHTEAALSLLPSMSLRPKDSSGYVNLRNHL